jgi:hypothetical protein
MIKSVFILVLFLLAFVSSFGQESLLKKFSKQGGVYEKTQKITLDTIGGYTIYFTLDGSKPSSSATKYKSEISIEKPTVVRAVFYKGGIPVETVTQSYIIGRKFNMAVVSIAIAQDDFFSYDRGIYVKGCCADTIPPYRGANFWRGWERQINVELYEPDNTLGINQGAAIRVFGGFSKGLPMKSLAIIAKSKYGPAKFKYPIFPNKDIKKYNSFVLRNSGGDFNNTHFRDALLTDLHEPLDMDIQAYRPCVVFVNGAYWGIHNIREKLNNHYLKENHGVNKDSLDLLKHRGDVQEGNKKEYQKLLDFLSKNTFESNEKIWELNKMMDIDNYINYNIAEIYVDNGDAGGNIRYWRAHKPDARWRWILFDLDLSFGIGSKVAYKENTLHKMTRLSTEAWPNPAWATFIIRKLLENDSIQDVYANRFADHLNTIYHPDNVIFKIDSIQNLIKDEMPFHGARWGLSMPKWEERVEAIRIFARQRPYYARKHLMEKFDLSDTVMVNVLPFEYEMGSLKLNSLKIKDEFSGWYFKDCKIRLKAKPKMGYEFVGWEGISETKSEVYLDLKTAITIKPLFKKKPKSGFYNKIVINEISIKQDSTITSEDWLEIANATSEKINLSNWQIVTDEKEKFIFPENTQIGAHSFIVVCKDIEKFQEVYQLSNDLIVQKDLGFGFGGKKDKIKLFDAELQLVDSLHYKIKEDFKALKDSDNRNLERENPKTKVWKISESVSPGVQNKGFKGIPKSEETENGFFQWIVIGGLALIVILLGIIISVKKKRNPIQKTETKSSH